MAGYKYFPIIFILFLYSLLFSQNISSPDSTSATSDTLSTEKISADSLHFLSKTEILKTLHLKEPLQEKIDKIPFVFNENLHFYTPFEDFTLKSLSDFTFYNRNFTSSMYYQLMIPIYDVSQKDITLFKQKQYSDRVPVLASYAGIGSQNMNFAYIDFYKGAVAKKTDLNFSYIGQSGNWNLKDSDLKSFHIFAKHRFVNGDINYTKDLIQTDIPAFYIRDTTDFQKQINLKFYQDNLVFKYRKFKSGFRFERMVKTDTTKYKTDKKQFFIKQQIDIGKLNFSPQYELIYTDTLKQYLKLKSKIDLSIIKLNMFILNNLRKNLISSDFTLNLPKNTALIFSYYKDDIFYNFLKEQLFFTYKSSKIAVGKQSIGDFSTLFISLNLYNQLKFNKLDIKLSSNIGYNNKTNENFPLLEYKGNYKGILNLKQDNSIFAGIRYFFITKDKNFNVYDIYLSPFFGFNITKNFSIQTDFINITNEYSYNFLSLSPFHINVGFRWIFFN